MSLKFIVLAVVAVGWLLAAVFAYAFISLFGFFGVGFYGLLLMFICAQVGLESGESTSRVAVPAGLPQDISRPRRILQGLQLLLVTTRFYMRVGLALTAVGFGGFLYLQLG